MQKYLKVLGSKAESSEVEGKSPSEVQGKSPSEVEGELSKGLASDGSCSIEDEIGLGGWIWVYYLVLFGGLLPLGTIFLSPSLQ
jgi:hypothetical protein